MAANPDAEDRFRLVGNQMSDPKYQLNTKQVIGGVVLMGAGGILGLAGAALAGSAFVAALRRRLREMEVPPRELARQNWVRAKAATAAGVGAWRNGQPASQPQSA